MYGADTTEGGSHGYGSQVGPDRESNEGRDPSDINRRRIAQNTPLPNPMFAPFGGGFPFLAGIPSGQLAQSWMPPIAPPSMPTGGINNLNQLYAAYGAAPGGVMPGFLPQSRGGSPGWLQNPQLPDWVLKQRMPF